jgi:hypothetical protein
LNASEWRDRKRKDCWGGEAKEIKRSHPLFRREVELEPEEEEEEEEGVVQSKVLGREPEKKHPETISYSTNHQQKEACVSKSYTKVQKINLQTELLMDSGAV